MIDLKSLTIEKAHNDIKNGVYSCEDLSKAYLDEIKKKDKDIHAYLEVYNDVLDQAKAAQKMFDDGKDTLLTGIPMAVKDNILIFGRKASSASKILEGYIASYDATAIKRLKDAGVVFLGRTNMDELALGSSTEKSAFCITKNPHDLNRVPGGSSGGSAASVAGLMSLASLGSDTGGSVRQPSAFCGVVGLKPTYGSVSRYGLMAGASSLDQIGPITKTVKDNEIIFNTISGKDKNDGTTIDKDTYNYKRLGKDKPIIGVPSFFMNMGGIKEEILNNFKDSIEKFKKLGFEIKDIELPNSAYASPIYYVINFAEVSSNFSRFDGVKYGLHKDGKDVIGDYFETRGEGFGKEARRRILLGTYVLSSGYYDAYYNRANNLRKVITNDFLKAFDKVDIIITPTTPSPAFKIGEKNNDPVSMYLEDIFTVTANLTGLPAMSIPSGYVKIEEKDLPLGIQMTGRHGDEKTLFEVGKVFLGE